MQKVPAASNAPLKVLLGAFLLLVGSNLGGKDSVVVGAQPQEAAVTKSETTTPDATVNEQALSTDSAAVSKEITAQTSSEAKVTSATVSSAAAPEAKKEPELSGWMGTVDSIFGKFLVGPMETILFFDFGTKSLVGTSVPFVVLWLLFGGLFLTIKMGFVNFRGFWHGIQLVSGKFDDPNEPGEVSHFQALSSALSGTVGLGNIAGVAVAVGVGGAGATFWMILCGLLGMTSKFSECSLAVLYRRVGADGTVLGGPMVYLKDGLEKIGLGKLGGFLSVVFAILCIGGSFGGGNSYQVVQSLNAIKTDPNLTILQDHPWIYGLIMVVAVGAVIIGGIKSIGQVAGAIVPFMCLAYMAMALAIIGLNYDKIPWAISQIFIGAFTPAGVAGGILGVMVQGVKRAAFSNEAGAGSAAIAHSAAKTDRPMSEGFVALLEPFIDTVVVCTLTALMVVITGMASDPQVQAMAAQSRGAEITLKAVTQNPDFEWFKYVLYVAVILFAYSTCISWSYYGERCFVFLFGNRSSMLYRGLFLFFTFLGSIVSPTNILNFSDMLILSMAVPNLIGVFLLSGVIRKEMDSYWKSYKAGELHRHKT
jgi:AGCS family alanine or glycine:cation symporter